MVGARALGELVVGHGLHERRLAALDLGDEQGEAPNVVEGVGAEVLELRSSASERLV